MRKILTICCIVAFVFVADQWTKHFMLGWLSMGEVKPVIPGFFNFTLAFNPGAAFGLWTSLPTNWRYLALFGTTLLALSAVVYFFRHPTYQHPLPRTALSMILGGALGNLYDRLTLRHVVDFLDVYYGTSHWPAFNIADSCICVGVFLLVIYRPKTSQAEALSTQPTA